MIVHSIVEGKEILNVKGFIIQMIHWILNSNVPLSGMSAHGRRGAEDIDYRIHVTIRGLISSDAMYLE